MNDIDDSIGRSYDERFGLYRGHDRLTARQASERWPEAMVLFDAQCSHLAERSGTVLCVSKRGRLSAEPPERGFTEMRTIWHPRVGVWVRRTWHVSFYYPAPERDDSEVVVTCNLFPTGPIGNCEPRATP